MGSSSFLVPMLTELESASSTILRRWCWNWFLLAPVQASIDPSPFFITPRHCLIITFCYWLIVMLDLIHIWAVQVRNHLKHLCLCALCLIDTPSRINSLSISSIVLSLLPPFYFHCSFPIRFRSRKHLLLKQNRRILQPRICRRSCLIVSWR